MVLSFVCVCAFVFVRSVGDAPKLLSGVTDVTVISPEVATLECSVKPGTKDAEIRWFVYFPRNSEMLISREILFSPIFSRRIYNLLPPALHFVGNNHARPSLNGSVNSLAAGSEPRKRKQSK